MSPRDLGFEGPRPVYLTKAPTSPGVHVFISDAAGGSGYAPASEAAKVFDALLELPVETRRALQLLIHENADTFCGATKAKGAKTKRHDWPPKPRRPE